MQPLKRIKDSPRGRKFEKAIATASGNGQELYLNYQSKKIPRECNPKSQGTRPGAKGTLARQKTTPGLENQNLLMVK